MIILNSTSDLVQVVTGSGVSSILVHSSWVDYSSGVAAAPNRTNTPAITSATTTTVVASPAASTQRNVKTISIYNSSAASDTITVQHTDGSNVITLFKYTLLAGETAMYYEGAASGSAWVVMDAAGGLKTSPAAGRLLKRSIVTQGTTTYTIGAATSSIKVFLQGAGGGGGGNPATASTGGSGGGAGGYAEKYFTGLTANATFTVQVGLAGSGASGANGTAGTSTFITVGATTVTANGGNFGLLAVAATSVAGGAAAAVSTNGDLNGSGAPGEEGVSSATSLIGGAGGSCDYGAGGGTSTTNATAGKNAIGFGGGGGGSSTLATAGALAGGNGANGVMIIEEYS